MAATTSELEDALAGANIVHSEVFRHARIVGFDVAKSGEWRNDGTEGVHADSGGGGMLRNQKDQSVRHVQIDAEFGPR